MMRGFLGAAVAGGRGPEGSGGVSSGGDGVCAVMVEPLTDRRALAA